MSSHFAACSRRDALSQNGNGHSGIPRHSSFHPNGGIVGALWECEPFRYQQDRALSAFLRIYLWVDIGAARLMLGRAQVPFHLGKCDMDQHTN